MALNKSTWQILTLSSLNASTESSLTSCSTIDLSSTIQLALTVEAEYASNASHPVQLRIYTAQSDWNDVDTSPYGYFDNELAAGSVARMTVPICPDPKYMRVTVLNQDDKAVSNVKVYATQGTV